MNGFEILKIECNKNIEEYSKVLSTYHLILKELAELQLNKSDEEITSLKEIETFYNYNLKSIIALLDLSIILKNLVEVNTDWEKAFFIKNGYLLIHEIIKKLKPYTGKTKVQNIIEQKYTNFEADFNNLLNSIEHFKNKPFYNLIIDTRNNIAGHIDESFTIYFETVFKLNGEKAALQIIEFLTILKAVINFFEFYQPISLEIISKIKSKN